MKKELKRYNSHHYIHIMKVISRLVKFLNANADGERTDCSKIGRESDEDIIKKYKKLYPAFAKSEKSRRDT